MNLLTDKLLNFLRWIRYLGVDVNSHSRADLCLHFGVIVGKRIDMMLKTVGTLKDMEIVDLIDNPGYLQGIKTYYQGSLHDSDQRMLDNTSNDDLWQAYVFLIK